MNHAPHTDPLHSSLVRRLLHPILGVITKLPLVGMLVLAMFGTYAVTTLVALLPLALPMPAVSAVYWGKIWGVVVAPWVFLGVFVTPSLRACVLWMCSLLGVLFGLCVCFVPNFARFVGW